MTIDVDYESHPRPRCGDVGPTAEGVQRGAPSVGCRVVAVEVAVVEHYPELAVLPRAVRERSANRAPRRGSRERSSPCCSARVDWSVARGGALT